MSMINPVVILAVAGGMAVLLLVVGLVISLRSERQSDYEARMQRYTSEMMDEEQIRQDEEMRKRALTDWMNQRMQRTSFGERISRELARADMKLKAGEYIALMVIAAVGTGFVAWFIGSQSLFLGLLGAVLGLFLPRFYVKRQQQARLHRFNEQLPDMLSLMVNGLRAGFSTVQAMESVSKELPPPICDEFRRVVQEMQLGVPMEKALANLVQRVPSDDLDMVITAINVQREVGGNLAEILDTISYTIRERVRVQGEIRVLTTQVAYSGRFLSLLPVLMLVAMYIMNRDYVMEFFSPDAGMCGYIAMGVSALLIIFGGVAMNKLSQIDY